MLRQLLPQGTLMVLLVVRCGASAVAQPADGAPKLPPTDAMAWALGTNLGLAAAVLEAGSAPQIVAEKLKTSEALAEALGTTVPPLPQKTTQTKSEFAADVLHYMLRGVEPTAKQLAKRHGERHAGLFEMGVKSAALTIVYGPGDESGLAVAQVVEDRGKRCKLPAPLWSPLVNAIRAKAPYDDVKGQVFQMHTQVRKHLMSGP